MEAYRKLLAAGKCNLLQINVPKLDGHALPVTTGMMVEACRIKEATGFP